MRLSEKEISGCFFAIAEKQDAPLITEMEKLCFPCDPWSEGTVREALENESYRVYVLYNIQLSKIFAYGIMYSCLDEADIAKVASHPDHRGEGFGGALLDGMLQDAAQCGVESIFLEVRESNSAARGLYTSRGFKEIGIRRKYYRNPAEDGVMMARKESF